MKKAGVAELKARLTSYLKRVKSGDEVLITERGEPIAKLVPLDTAEKRGPRRERLAKAGLLRLGTGTVPRSCLTAPEGSQEIGEAVLAALLSERREGR
ncbi:MAG: type II toxin-antitoxin system Phd/YefM family antitoxin [Vicinamibacteria bacterium]